MYILSGCGFIAGFSLALGPGKSWVDVAVGGAGGGYTVTLIEGAAAADGGGGVSGGGPGGGVGTSIGVWTGCGGREGSRWDGGSIGCVMTVGGVG